MYDIHCPFCGIVTNADGVKFSISEFVEEIFNQRLEEKYNDGILGVIDESEINLILDNDFLWDMSVTDIDNCRSEGMFVLSGVSLVKRFGEKAVNMLHNIREVAVREILLSTNLESALDANAPVKALVEEILQSISHERLLRTEVSMDDRLAAVLNLIRYAKTNKILFKINLKIEEDRDDKNECINKDIRSVDDRIICKSKRCPNCGNELSKLSGKYEEKIISFIGSPAAGKSAYLAAAINKLLSTGQSEYGIQVIFDYQSSDYIAFNEACLIPYSKGFAITKTNQGTFPQLSMALKNTKLGKTYLYTFVDIPGETFIDENARDFSDMLANRRIIKYADVIWFCVSAKQLFSSKIGRVRRTKNDAAIENEEMKDLRILGQNTINFANEMYKDGEKKPALALILTKSDLLSQFIMENVFSPDEERNKLIKKDYFKMICSAPHGGYHSDSEDYDYYDGEPNTLGYMNDGKLIYQKFINDVKRIGEFIRKYGEVNSAEEFMGSISGAFHKKNCLCFSEASYGRGPVEKYSMEIAVRFLLSHKERLQPRDYEDILDIFGEKEITAFENGSGKLPVIKDAEDINYIQNLYKKLNPIYPFGIMSILEWTFAYTGFIECIENDGEKWHVIPTSGPDFDTLQTRLTLETEGGNILVGNRQSSAVKSEASEIGWFRRLFCR